MHALMVDLMGGAPMDEAMLQARTQDIVEARWPSWKRERALRLAISGDMVEYDALNAFLETVEVAVDQSRADTALLREAIAVEKAAARLKSPVDEGPRYEADLIEREEAKVKIETAPEPVKALVVVREPKAKEPQ